MPAVRPWQPPRVALRPGCGPGLPRPALAVLAAAGALAGSLAMRAPAPAVAATAPAPVEARLLALSDAFPADTFTVWVAFADKGEHDASDLSRRLLEAERALSARGRARRMRAGLAPLVDERDLPVEPAYLDSLESRGLHPFAASRWLNRVALRVPGARVRELGRLPFVGGICRVERVRLSADPVTRGDAGPVAPVPAGGSRAGSTALDYGLNRAPLEQIGVPALHDSGFTGAGLLIAVLDEGFNAHDTHEALVGAVWGPGRRRDFVEGDTVVTDLSQPASFSHGTWTLGCMAGNRPGRYVGAAFGASYALARTEVHVTEQPVEMLYWAQAAEWADSLGADVISSSLGYFWFDDPLDNFSYADMDGATTDVSRAARIAAARGILVVNSVGNEGDKPWHYLIAPADVDGDSLIAVGAVDAFGGTASFSSYGPSADGRIKPDLAARGVDSPLVSASGDPTAYTAFDGTSFSAPLVAGLAACLWQARPQWRAVDVIRALRETASRVSRPNDRVGYGIPNGGTALCWSPGGPLAPPGTAVVLGPNPLRAGGPPVRVRVMAGGVQSGAQRGRVRVLDAAGREIRPLWSGEIARGECLDVWWDGSDGEGRHAPPGIYYIALSAGGEVASARIVALR